MGGIGAHLRESGRSFAAVFRSPGLRRLQCAWSAVALGHWGLLVAVSVYAYAQDGEKAVGIVFLLRLVPAGLLAPFVGVLGDRYRRELVLFVSALLRCGLCAGAAVAVAMDGPSVLVYALAILTSIANAPYKSAQQAIMPTLAATPNELTAANAVSSTVESLAFFLGPALAGVLLALSGTDVVFAVAAAMFGAASLVLLRLHAPRSEVAKEVQASTIFSECIAGFRVVFQHRELRVLMGLFTAQTLIAGLMLVFLVVVAIELLDIGESGVGWLNSAFGVGALLGALGALGLTGAKRLSPGFLVGLLLWGLPLVVLGLWSPVIIAFVLFAIMGAGNSLVDVAGYTLVQRAVPDEVLARVFGVLQFFLLSALGIGGLLAPILTDIFGLENALIISGLFLPVLVALFGRTVAKIDAEAAAPEAQELRLLTGVPIFAPLPGTALEHIAGRLVPLRIEPGTVILREGDAGDRFYVIVEGEVEVSAEGKTIATQGPGGYFGEIALLKDVPRTATVKAKTPVVLYALEREDFLATVTGHAPSAKAAETVVASRLSDLTTAAGSPISS
jgi:MFS family permease